MGDTQHCDFRNRTLAKSPNLLLENVRQTLKTLPLVVRIDEAMRSSPAHRNLVSCNARRPKTRCGVKAL